MHAHMFLCAAANVSLVATKQRRAKAPGAANARKMPSSKREPWCAAVRAAKIPTIWGSCGSSGAGVGGRVAGGRWRPNTRVTLRTPLFLRAQPCVPGRRDAEVGFAFRRIILIRCCSLPVLQSFDAVRCQSCLPLVQFSPSGWFHYSTVFLSAVTIVLLKCTESVGRS